jgi:cytochrome c oxidase assembly protein subunit 15
MAHRYGAYALIALIAWLVRRSRASSDALVRRLAAWLLALVLVQAGIGVTNILLGIPVWVSAVHLGMAALLLALSLTATFRLTVARAAQRALAAAMAR